jgi:predicted metal-dependent hydrolase
MLMGDEQTERVPEKIVALVPWQALLRDEVALLAAPGAHHKALVRLAHSLHRDQAIDRDDLSDLLEQADGALAYAMEALLDRQIDE